MELPLNHKKDDYHLFDQSHKRIIPELKIKEIKDIRINYQGIIFKGIIPLLSSFSNGTIPWLSKSQKIKLVKKHYIRNKLFFQDPFLVKSLITKKIKKVEECIWFTDNWSNGYFHWLMDALPRLWVVKEKLPEKCIALPSYYRDISFVQESLKAWNIKDIIYIEKNEILQVNKLILPLHTASSGNYNYKIINDLRKIYRNYYTRGKDWENIYVSRSKAKRRKVLNENELISILKKYNFRIINFEDYNWEEQVEICLTAKILISIHGAGLTNMLFMEKENYIFELGRPNNQFYHYFSLARTLGLNYLYQKGKLKGKDKNHSNIFINPDEFEKNMKIIMNYEVSS